MADAWIDMIPEDEAEGELRVLYDEMRDPQFGVVDNIMRIHSLNVASLRDHYQLYRNVMYGKSGLTRPEREMVAVVVSAANRCHY
jgi:uncharacterized peroxidase-related enzyme